MNNWDFHSLRMDFSSMYEGNHHPSDIDMFYLGANDFLILGEIKNESGELKDGQRRMLERLINGWKSDGMVLYITHDKYVQNGDTVVNVAECRVKEVYRKGHECWESPRGVTKVKDIIEEHSSGKARAITNAIESRFGIIRFTGSSADSLSRLCNKNGEAR